MTGHRQESSNWGQRESDTQHDMTKRSKTLGIAITQHDRQSHKRQAETQGIDKPGTDHKGDAVKEYKTEGAVSRDDSGGDFPDGCPWIQGVEFCVQPAIEGHGGTTRKDHAADHEKEREPKSRYGTKIERPGRAYKLTLGGEMLSDRVKYPQKKPDQRKGHRKDRMGEFYQA